MNEDGPSRGDIGAHILRLIEEIHANSVLHLQMQGDIYNLLMYGRKPTKPVVPPNPKSVPIKGRFEGADPVRVLDALGNLVGKFRGRG